MKETRDVSDVEPAFPSSVVMAPVVDIVDTPTDEVPSVTDDSVEADISSSDSVVPEVGEVISESVVSCSVVTIEVLSRVFVVVSVASDEDFDNIDVCDSMFVVVNEPIVVVVIVVETLSGPLTKTLST